MRFLIALASVVWALPLLAQTNQPAPAITGIETIDSLINASPILIVAIAIQLVNIAIVKSESIPNKVLPILNLVLGGASYPAAIGTWNFKNVLLGIMAGAGSTGVYEVFKQFRPGSTPPTPPTPPTQPPTP